MGHDIETMLEASKLLESWGYEFKFDLYGSGIKYEISKKKLRDLSIKSTNIYGLISKDKIVSKLKSYDCAIAAIINSSIYKYGINLNKLVSYMLASRPIILCSSAPNDLVKDSRCGFSCQSKDYYSLAKLMEKIINLPFEDRAKLAFNGFDYLNKNLSMDKLGKKMNSAIRKNKLLC